MAVMEEDVILEIVVRLPLKYAIRCMVLNKNLFRLISQQKKALVSSAYTDIKGSIFCRYNHDTFKRITPGRSKISITTRSTLEMRNSENPVILDSCNGVFLLNFVKQRRICVFNPITAGIMPLSSLIKLRLSEAVVALAVDLDVQSNFQFKLVFAQTFSHSDEETLWRFTLLVPSGGTSWLIKSPVELICAGDPCGCSRFVYVHGCVYWADEENHSIIMFDVEKEKARSIDWPLYDTENSAFLCGSSDGSLQSVYILQNEVEIEIHSYDQVEDGWQLKHKFTNIVSCPRVLFCNGKHLLVAEDPPVWLGRVGKRPRKDPEEEIFMYDILRDMWEEISPKDFSFDIYDPNTVFSFVPTLAKVSDKYLVDPDIEFAEVYLRGLQRLVMQET